MRNTGRLKPAVRLRGRPMLPGVVAIVAVAIGGLACGGDEPHRGADDRPGVQAAIVAVEETMWEAGLEVTAGVLPLRRATPGTALMGTVVQVLRQEGDRVRAGSVLARVESRNESARLAQAEAAVAGARAMAENARLTRERMERLFERQAATRKNLDDAIAGHEAAVANLEAAEEGVKAARVFVDYGEVTAPFGGVVVEKHVEVGDMAAPGAPLFVVEDVTKVKVEAQVPESVARDLRPGDPVAVRVAGTERPGALAEVLPAGDPRSRTFTVRVVLDNPGDLRSGMFARLRLPGKQRSVLAVPETALLRQGPLTGLFVVDAGDVARLRWVSAGETREGAVEILTGLNRGERVVIRPPHDLTDGRRVLGL